VYSTIAGISSLGTSRLGLSSALPPFPFGGAAFLAFGSAAAFFASASFLASSAFFSSSHFLSASASSFS
jgi:hypothetical protein